VDRVAWRKDVESEPEFMTVLAEIGSSSEFVMVWRSRLMTQVDYVKRGRQQYNMILLAGAMEF